MDSRTVEAWWKRNWKWSVPLGCLAVVLLTVGFAATITVGVFSAMRSSDAYQGAIARTRAHTVTLEALGSPIEEGWYVLGEINVTGPKGDADLAIPISGPRGDATLYLTATKSAGVWTYSALVVEIERTGERIDLLAPATSTS